MSTDSEETAPLSMWNGALRFGLELAALVGLGAGAWTLAAGPARWILAVAVPLAAATLWGVFRVPGDPGDAPVAIPGSARLIIEVVVLGGGAIGFALAYGPAVWLTYALLLVFHYLAAFDRVRWLLARR